MTAKSFKQMIADKDIKRADAMKVRMEDIHEEPGFNLRRENEDLENSIEALAEHIARGGIVPALEVRPRDGGGVWVVDGHRRRRAYLRAEQKGASIRDANGELWIAVVAFTGNDADRVARIITSAEGRSLSLLEMADGYKRLTAFGWTAQQIAEKVGKTRQHVDQALILANANSDVQVLVAGGNVSATSAIDAVRKHGEGAGRVLGGAVSAAKAAGKTKATSGAIQGKPLPRKLVTGVEEALDRFVQTTDTKTLSVDKAALWALLDIAADIRETRRKQAERGQAKAGKDAPMDIPEVAA